MHQCLKYYREGERKINADIKSFTVAESHLADRMFFEEDAALKESILATISSIANGSVKNAKETRVPPKYGGDGSINLQQQRKEEKE